METLLERLRAWGCAVGDTLRNLDGDAELYVRCVRMFARDNNFDALTQALQAGDTTAVFEAAHTIKGVAGNLGLSPLFSLSSALSDLARPGQPEPDPEQLRAMGAPLLESYGEFCTRVEDKA